MQAIGDVSTWCMPFDEEEGLSHGVCLVENDTFFGMNKALEVLQYWKFDRNHVLRVYPHEEVSSMAVGARKLCNLHDSLIKDYEEFESGKRK